MPLHEVSANTDAVAARVKKTANQSISHNTVTALTFDAEDFDTHGFHDNVTNNTRLTIPAGYAGMYLAIAQAGFASHTLGDRFVWVSKNGSTDRLGLTTNQPEDGTWCAQASAVLDLVGGDYLEAYVYQGSGGALNALFAANSAPCYFQLVRF